MTFRTNRFYQIRKRIHLLLSLMLVVSLVVVAPPEGAEASNREVETGRTAAGITPEQPFGPNVHIMDPSMPIADIQRVADSIFAVQERSEFGSERHAILLKPGVYHNLNMKVGFYTQVSGLGQHPSDVDIRGGVTVNADWNNGNALINFWRAAENFSVTPPSGTSMQWAVAQAAPMRRVHVKGQLELFDFDPSWNAGYASGGFLADSKVDGTIVPASQQQWFSRNNQYGGWSNGVWNMVFVGDQQPPSGEFPEAPYTVVDKSPIMREKPYLYLDKDGKYNVFVPALRQDAKGVSWEKGQTPGTSIPIEQFYIATPEGSDADHINAALDEGKHVIFTPGIYPLTDTIRVTKPDTVVMGLGLATIIPEKGQKGMTVADEDGIIIASLLFDAGEAGTPSLLEVGTEGSNQSHTSNPISLHDLFFRVGGAHAGKADTNLIINSNDVIGDHFWIWRADHGAGAGGWTTNDSLNGLIVNGEDVTIYGLFNEHHNEYQTIWNGEGGRLYFYQSEIPYEVPDQASWMNNGGKVNGYASYKVADSVKTHEAWGLGVYSYFRDASIKAHSAIEVPDTPGVHIHHATSVFLAGNGEITHVINDTGATANIGSVRQTVKEYGGSPGPETVEVVLDREGWIATAYKSSTADALPSLAIDGNPGTRWANQEAQLPSGAQWFQLDMGRERSFDTVKLESGSDYPRGYRIEVSKDAESWTEVASGTGSATTVAAFDMQSARYVRIVQTGSASSNWWSLNEVNVSVKGEPAAVTGVSLSPSELSLKERQSARLTAAVTPAEASNKTVSWTTSDASIASVDSSGKVTALRAGSAVITATTTDGGKTAESTVTVIAGDSLPEPIDNGKGVAAIKYLSTAPDKLTDLGIGWTYNWSIDYAGDAQDLDYVPMLWGPGAVTDANIEKLKEGKASGRYDTLLGYNEPELVEQSNTSVADTIKEWPRLMETGLRLGSPAVAYTYDNSYAAGKNWLNEFMAQAEEHHYPVDFIAIHFYPDFTDPEAVTKLKSTLETLYEQYDKPIWITEIGAIPFGTTHKTPTEELALSYMKKLIPMLEALPFIERYAWFGDNCAHDRGCAYTSLFDLSDQLTAIGKGFRDPASIPDSEPAAMLDRSGWSATASSTAFGTLPSFAFDGDLGRQWSTEAGQVGGEWYLLDMGKQENVSGITLDTGTNATFDYARGYRIELSTNGLEWTKASEGSGNAQSLQVSWPTQEARYIKMTQTGHDGFWRWSINELNVFGGQPEAQTAATLNGPESVYPGEELSLQLGIQALSGSFTTLQMVLHYDPTVWGVETLLNDDGTLSLANSILEPVEEKLMILGTAVKADKGEILIIAASADGEGISGDVGPLLTLRMHALNTAAAGETKLKLAKIVTAYEGIAKEAAEAELVLQVLTADKTALSTAIEEAQSLHQASTEGNQAGQYPSGSKAVLQTAIQAAVTVRDDAGATNEEVAQALTALQASIQHFKAAVNPATPINTDKIALASVIEQAQRIIHAAKPGSKVGQYPAEAMAAFREAISLAQSVYGDNYVSQAQVDSAVSGLQTAIQAFAATITSLVEGATSITVNDLSIIAKYYGVRSGDPEWSKIQAADLYDTGEIDIRVLAAIAKLIISDWLDEDDN